MPADKVFITKHSDEAVSVLEEIVADSDIILVKGSRGVHMDQIVSEMEEG